jgi:hypothetical protein
MVVDHFHAERRGESTLIIGLKGIGAIFVVSLSVWLGL